MSPDDPTERRGSPTEYRNYVPEERPERGDTGPFDERYGRLRGHFKRRQGLYGAYQRWLNEARIGTTYDIYLARSVKFGAVATVLGSAIAVIVLALGTFSGGTVGFVFSPGISVCLVVLTGLFSGGGLVSGRFLYPRLRARKRRRQIDIVLPHAVVFMRALSHSGRDPITVIDELAALEEIYGAVAREFDAVRKDIELYNDGLLTALENARARTPSGQLGEFFDDLTGVIEAGGDVDAFFDQRASDQLERTKAELEELLEALVTLAEAYVTLVFFGPLLLLVVLIVFGITGRDVVDYLALLTYVGIPIGIAGSILAIRILSRPYRIEIGDVIDREKRDRTPPESTEPWFAEYETRLRRRRLRRRFREPITTLRRDPVYTLAVTVPVAIAGLWVAVVTGLLDPAPEAYVAAPIRYTTGFVVIPLLVVTVPLMGFHELMRRRQRATEKRFPDVLQTLASSNRRGMDFTEGIDLVSRRYEEPIASEFRTLSRDIKLDRDTVRALTAFANRLRIPHLAMTVSVLRELVTATDDLSDPVQSLATDLDTRLSLQRTRNRQMATYSVVIVLGILVYLLLVIVLDSLFIPRMTDLPASDTWLFTGGSPTVIYREIFFHSALIQAFGNGLLLGTLTDDSLASGLKYSNALTGIVLVGFLLAP